MKTSGQRTEKCNKRFKKCDGHDLPRSEIIMNCCSQIN